MWEPKEGFDVGSPPLTSAILLKRILSPPSFTETGQRRHVHLFSFLKFPGPRLWNSSRLPKVPTETTLHFSPAHTLNPALTRTPREMSDDHHPESHTCPEVSHLQVFAHTVPSTWNALPTTLTTHLKGGPSLGRPSSLPLTCCQCPIPPRTPPVPLLGHTLTHSATEVLVQGQDGYVIIAQSDALYIVGSQ